MQKGRCGKGVGLRELMGWAVGSEGTKVLEFCLMFVFGEAVSDPAGGWTVGQMRLSEQMPFCPLTQVRAQLAASDSACLRRLAVGGHAARC